MGTLPERKRPRAPSHDSAHEKLSLALLNINGLRNKIHEVRHIIARDKLHVVALCETKLNASVEDSAVYIPGFSMWRKDRNDKSNNKGGGVALYVQDHIETILRPDLMNPEADEENPEAEIIWVEMKLPEGRPVLLGCCYRPTKDERKYLKHIKKTINLISEKEKDKDIFLMGDFNIDWNLEEKKNTDKAIKALGWTQIVKVPTRVTLDSETCIDHIYTNISNPLEPKSIPTGCSDHNLITVKIDRNVPQSEGNFRSNQFDREEFQEDIYTKWKKVKDKSLEEFSKIFLEVADSYAPLERQDIYCLVTLDDQLKSFVSDRDNIKYEMMNNIYNSIKKKKKLQENIDNYIKEKPQNPPAVEGNAAESPFHRPQTEASKAKPPQQINQTSTETTDSGSVSLDVVGGQRGSGAFSFEKTRFTAVRRCLEYVCDHFVNVIDKTEAELLKLVVDFISAPIRDILKKCTEDKKFPDELKKIKSLTFSTANYIQIRQSSSADRLPIILSYVFDTILYERAKASFISNEKNSAATLKESLEQLETDCSSLDEANTAVGVLFLDFTSSFDTISHDELITKLEESDFSSSALELIKSFLSIHEGSSGLPRGSCLAQLLLIIIINDLKKNLEPSAVICNSYMMICADGDPETVETELDNKTKAVRTWAKPFNITFEIRRRQFKPSELSGMISILQSMILCHGNESNWIRAPGNVVKQNGDWKYDNVSKELELHFGKEYKVEPEKVNNSQQKSQTRKQQRSADSVRDTPEVAPQDQVLPQRNTRRKTEK